MEIQGLFKDFKDMSEIQGCGHPVHNAGRLRSVVYKVALYHWSGAQRKFHERIWALLQLLIDQG